MAYQVTVSTTFGVRLLTYIEANTLQEAINKIAEYNIKYTDWDMKLYSNFAHSNNEMLPVKYLEVVQCGI